MNKILYAQRLGYTVDREGVVYKPNGDEQKLRASGNTPYLMFSLRHEGKVLNIPVHRLQAYLLYGELLFEKGVVVRHLDGNPTNNKISNIAIGSSSENSMDRPRELRLATAKKANKASTIVTRKYNYEAIKKDRADGMNYQKLMKKFGITSKGTVSYIVNNSN